jgi:nicotinate phosphoribosyltransferase
MLTDLYQLTMLQAYFVNGMRERSTFEMVVRSLPSRRSFLLAAGLEQVLGYLEQLRFSEEELAWLRGCGRFRADFVDSLAELQFTGDVHALPEGTVFFPQEPLLRITAPLPEAQLVESRVVNLLQFQTLIASKAARAVIAAPDKLLVDFGMRRAHGAEAGRLAARAAYVAGFAGTATVLAGMDFGIPLYGTMAHSFILAHDDEAQAFERFAAANPGNVVLLLDTYDTEAAARKVVALAPRLRARETPVVGVRLDSGDLGAHARRVRRILDEGGLHAVSIFASGNLDEYAVRDLVASGAPIDGFGIGTRLDVSADAPYLDCAYKLHEYAGQPRWKRSEGKRTWPGRKQVYRTFEHGVMAGDVVTLEADVQPGRPLLEPVMRDGRRLGSAVALEDTRRNATRNLEQLPLPLRRLEGDATYEVQLAPAMCRLAEATDAMND